MGKSGLPDNHRFLSSSSGNCREGIWAGWDLVLFGIIVLHILRHGYTGYWLEVI